MSTYNSNIVTNTSPAKFGVYPQWVWGYVSIANATSLTTSDTIYLCKIPAGTLLVPAFVIDLPVLDGGGGSASLTLSLKDDTNSTTSLVYGPTGTALTSAQTYVSASTTGQAGGLITEANVAHGVIGITYQTQQNLVLVPAFNANAACSAVTIYFGFQFAPI